MTDKDEAKRRHIAENVRVAEREWFGENRLSERSLLGIAKIALTQKQLSNLPWLRRQIEIHIKNERDQKNL